MNAQTTAPPGTCGLRNGYPPDSVPPNLQLPGQRVDQSDRNGMGGCFPRLSDVSRVRKVLKRGTPKTHVIAKEEMLRRHTPVTLGAPEHHALDVGPWRVTEAHFPPHSRLEPHVHARHVFAVIMDGSFDDLFANQTLECVPSTVLVEPAEDKHANQFGNQGAHVLIVEPDPNQADLLHPCRDLFSEPTSFMSPAAANLAVRLSHEVHTRDDLTPLAVEGLVLELFVEAARKAKRDRHHAPMPLWLKRATDYLHDSFQQPIRISDVAAIGDVHPTHLARVFRKHHGLTVAGYVRRLRLLWTAMRLRNRDQGLSQIAAEAGFTDQSHFTRVFKAEFSITPAQYRRHGAPPRREPT